MQEVERDHSRMTDYQSFYEHGGPITESDSAMLANRVLKTDGSYVAETYSPAVSQARKKINVEQVDEVPLARTECMPATKPITEMLIAQNLELDNLANAGLTGEMWAPVIGRGEDLMIIYDRAKKRNVAVGKCETITSEISWRYESVIEGDLNHGLPAIIGGWTETLRTNYAVERSGLNRSWINLVSSPDMVDKPPLLTSVAGYKEDADVTSLDKRVLREAQLRTGYDQDTLKEGWSNIWHTMKRVLDQDCHVYTFFLLWKRYIAMLQASLILDAHPTWKMEQGWQQGNYNYTHTFENFANVLKDVNKGKNWIHMDKRTNAQYRVAIMWALSDPDTNGITIQGDGKNWVPTAENTRHNTLLNADQYGMLFHLEEEKDQFMREAQELTGQRDQFLTPEIMRVAIQMYASQLAMGNECTLGYKVAIRYTAFAHQPNASEQIGLSLPPAKHYRDIMPSWLAPDKVGVPAGKGASFTWQEALWGGAVIREQYYISLNMDACQHSGLRPSKYDARFVDGDPHTSRQLQLFRAGYLNTTAGLDAVQPSHAERRVQVLKAVFKYEDPVGGRVDISGMLAKRHWDNIDFVPIRSLLMMNHKAFPRSILTSIAPTRVKTLAYPDKSWSQHSFMCIMENADLSRQYCGDNRDWAKDRIELVRAPTLQEQLLYVDKEHYWIFKGVHEQHYANPNMDFAVDPFEAFDMDFPDFDVINTYSRGTLPSWGSIAPSPPSGGGVESNNPQHQNRSGRVGDWSKGSNADGAPENTDGGKGKGKSNVPESTKWGEQVDNYEQMSPEEKREADKAGRGTIAGDGDRKVADAVAKKEAEIAQLRNQKAEREAKIEREQDTDDKQSTRDKALEEMNEKARERKKKRQEKDVLSPAVDILGGRKTPAITCIGNNVMDREFQYVNARRIIKYDKGKHTGLVEKDEIIAFVKEVIHNTAVAVVRAARPQQPTKLPQRVSREVIFMSKSLAGEDLCGKEDITGDKGDEIPFNETIMRAYTDKNRVYYDVANGILTVPGIGMMHLPGNEIWKDCLDWQGFMLGASPENIERYNANADKMSDQPIAPPRPKPEATDDDTDQ
jgi:hypothetical protein